MTIKMKLSGLLLGILLATTSVFAGESCGAGKCGAAMMKDSKVACDMKAKEHKCNCEDKKKCTCETKEKCSCSMKKEMKGSCGAGKCGTDMKTDSKNDMKDTSATK